MASRDRSLARSSSSSSSSTSVVVVVVVGRRRSSSVGQTPFVCHPPATDRPTERARASDTDESRTIKRGRTRNDVACRRARPSPARRTTEATVKTDEDDGRSVIRRASSARSARAATRHEGRRDGRTDAATRRFGALGNTVVRGCRCLCCVSEVSRCVWIWFARTTTTTEDDDEDDDQDDGGRR